MPPVREAAELTSNPSPDYHAAPLESNLFEWHFTLRGPSDSSFSKGIYHGRITLPTQYPLRPPSFRFLTPSGRFECNREICLSISGFHEESWQPAWGVRTAIIALRSHMEVPAQGQVGGIDSDADTRKRLADSSQKFVCPACARSNAEILAEQQELANGTQARSQADEKVPAGLKLAYKDDLQASSETTPGQATSEVQVSKPEPAATATEAPTSAPAVTAPPAPVPTARVSLQVQARGPPRRDVSDLQLDAAIWILGALLVILLARLALRMLDD